MNKSNIYNTLILLPLYWLFSGMLIMGGGDKPMVAMVVISLITTLCCYGVNSAKTNIKQDKFLWVILAMTAYALFSYQYHGFSSREVRALLSGSLFLIFFPRALLTTNLLRGLTLIGSICALLATYYYGQYLSIERAHWPINAIPLATASAVLGVISFVMLFSKDETKLAKAISLLTVTFSICAIMLSQTRGIWLAYCVSLLFLLLSLNKSKIFSFKYLTFAALFLAVIGASAQPVLSERIEKTREEIHRISKGDLSSSIGLRFQMWLASPQLIGDKWIVGQGAKHAEQLKVLVKEEKVSAELAKLNPSHYHNQYIDRFIKNGLIGFTLLLLLLIVPSIRAQKVNAEWRLIINGIVILFAVASLTDVPFNHAQTALFYMLAICIINNNLESKENTNPL